MPVDILGSPRIPIAEWKALSAAIAKQQTWLEVPTLTRHWHVLLEARPVASRLVEVPTLPADNERRSLGLLRRGGWWSAERTASLSGRTVWLTRPRRSDSRT